MLKNHISKLLISMLAVLLIFMFPFSAFAKNEAVSQFKKAEEMQNKYPEFGTRPWEEKLNIDIEQHKKDVKTNCNNAQKEYEEKIRKIKEQKKKEAEERKRKEEEKKQLEKEAKETQDEYTRIKKEELAKSIKEGHWESIGSKRITHYCPACNTPANSYSSSSGQKLYDGAVACSWLPLGTIIKINGKIYRNIDRCGTSAIDVFRDTPDGCSCNVAGSYSAEVFVLKK